MSGADVDRRNVKPYQPIRLVKRDGTEPKAPLVVEVARDHDIEKAAQLLAAHTMRECCAESGDDVERFLRLMTDQAQAFERAAAKLRTSAFRGMKKVSLLKAKTKQHDARKAKA